MPIDPSRYGLITNEFRFREAYNASIDTRYAKARELEIPTNMRMADTASLLSDMFGVIGAVRRRFQVEVSGTTSYSINSFSTSVPLVSFTCPEFGVSNLTCMVVGCNIDEEKDSTTLELWG